MYVGAHIANAAKEVTFDNFMEFINLTENQDKTFELIGGYLVAMAGNATSNHQSICSDIVREVGVYLKGKHCKVFQDLNVYLFKEDIGKCKNVFQPDIMVGCDRSKMTNRGYEGSPEWVIEVISKSTARNDYFTKLNYYMEYGVAEYWIVDQFANQIVVYLNSDEGSPLVQRYTFSDSVKVGQFDDLYIDFNEVLLSLPNR